MNESAFITRLQRLTDEHVAASGWPELFLRLPQPRCYQHPDWLLAANRHLLDHQLNVASVHRGGQLALVLPWLARANGRRATAPMHDHLTLGDALFDPALSLHQCSLCLQQSLSIEGSIPWDWRITNVPHQSLLVQTTASHPQWERRLARQSAWFDLTQKDSPGSGKLKRNLRRLRKQLRQQGELHSEWVSHVDDLPEALAHFMTLEDAGWKGRQGLGTAVADSCRLQGFYEALLKPRFPGMQVVIGLLWLDGHCVGAQYAVVTGRCLSLLKIAYDESFSHYSPGSLLLQDTAEYAMALGMHTLSLVSNPDWAARWHPHIEPVWHLAWFAANTAGRTLRAGERLGQLTRRSLKTCSMRKTT